MKKVQIISKDGNKVEVYYLSDHPLNKIVASENVVAKEEPFPALGELEVLGSSPCNVGPVGEVGPLGLDATLGKAFEPLYEKPLKQFPFDPKQHISNLLFGMKSPSTVALDDSLESDVVEQEDLKADNLYRIKGLNVIAKFVRQHPLRPQGQHPDETRAGGNLFEFNFHGYHFWVGGTMILKHR